MSGSKKGQAPAGNTTTTTSSAPWQPQQPYLKQVLGRAQDLYQNQTPTYFPNSTYASLNPNEQGALQQLVTKGDNQGSSPLMTNSTQFANYMANGNYLQDNPGTKPLDKIANGSGLPGSIGGASNDLGQFANGSQTDPYLNSLSQSVMSQVVPGIQSQFINGGGLSSPDAAYATSQGATAALAPVLNQALQQEQSNQLSAAGTLGNLGLGQAGVQETAANSAGTLYNTGTGQMIQNEALLPQTLSAQTQGANTALQAGQLQQANQQNAINANIQRYNYNQELPYQKLNEYAGDVTGNFGGLSSTTSPYFENQGANVLTGGLGGAMLGNSLLGASGLGLSGGMASGLGAGLGVLLSI